jgi:hypothetical protein
MTLVAVLCFVAFMYLCGFGPTLLLTTAEESPDRLVVMPALGLCSYIVVAMALAQFDLTGGVIAPIVTALFVVLSVLGWMKGTKPTLSEFRKAAPIALLGALTVAVAGLPLFRTGYADYWGFANPDAAVLMPLVDWIRSHPLSIPPYYHADPEGFRGITLNVIFGIYYLTIAVSQITAIPAGLLFTSTILSLVFLVPGTVYSLAAAVGLSDVRCKAAATLIVCSSLVPFTFYLDSLGSFTVIAVMPVSVAFALRYIARPTVRLAVALAIACAGLYFGYLANIGFTGLLVGTVLACGVWKGALSLRRAVLTGGAIAAVIVLIFPGFALNLLKLFMIEAFRSRFVKGPPDEIILGLSSGLTENIFPLYWGFEMRNLVAWPFHHSGILAWAVAVGLSALVLVGLCTRLSRLPSVFRVILGVVLAVVVAYVLAGNGYGVFKLAAWTDPFLILAFASIIFDIHLALRSRRHRVLAWIPLGALFVYVVPNLAMTLELGARATEYGHEPGAGNAPMSLREMRELATMHPGLGRREIAVAVSDWVAQRWIECYLGPRWPSYLPPITLAAHDSTPARPAPEIRRYLLHWKTPLADVVAPPDCPAVWSNRLFALSSLNDCRNALVFGVGWYRFERSETTLLLSRFRWLRKRGELLLIHPDGSPQRLRLGFVAGPGLSSPKRTISIFLNGQEIDSFDIVGSGTVLTLPFVATGPIAQLEVAVKEDAHPLARAFGLWNRWVPREPRVLNVAITEVILIGQEVSLKLPPSLDLGSAQGWHSPSSGFFPDRWIGDEATLDLQSPGVPNEIRITGMAPQGVNLPFPFHVRLAVNGMQLPACSISGPGEFEALCGIPATVQRALRADEPERIVIRPEATFVAWPDVRPLSLRVKTIALVTNGTD